MKFTKKGSAKGYIEAREALDFFQQFDASGWADQVDPGTRAAISRASQVARDLPDYFAAHLHGEARAGLTPDVLSLAKQLRANREIVDAFAARYG